jgi:hypothetical protein
MSGTSVGLQPEPVLHAHRPTPVMLQPEPVLHVHQPTSVGLQPEPVLHVQQLELLVQLLALKELLSRLPRTSLCKI